MQATIIFKKVFLQLYLEECPVPEDFGSRCVCRQLSGRLKLFVPISHLTKNDLIGNGSETKAYRGRHTHIQVQFVHGH